MECPNLRDVTRGLKYRVPQEPSLHDSIHVWIIHQLHGLRRRCWRLSRGESWDGVNKAAFGLRVQGFHAVLQPDSRAILMWLVFPGSSLPLGATVEHSSPSRDTSNPVVLIEHGRSVVSTSVSTSSSVLGWVLRSEAARGMASCAPTSARRYRSMFMDLEMLFAEVPLASCLPVLHRMMSQSLLQALPRRVRERPLAHRGRTLPPGRRLPCLGIR